MFQSYVRLPEGVYSQYSSKNCLSYETKTTDIPPIRTLLWQIVSFAVPTAGFWRTFIGGIPVARVPKGSLGSLGRMGKALIIDVLLGASEHFFYLSKKMGIDGNVIIPTDEVHHFSEMIPMDPCPLRRYLYNLPVIIPQSHFLRWYLDP